MNLTELLKELTIFNDGIEPKDFQYHSENGLIIAELEYLLPAARINDAVDLTFNKSKFKSATIDITNGAGDSLVISFYARNVLDYTNKIIPGTYKSLYTITASSYQVIVLNDYVKYIGLNLISNAVALTTSVRLNLTLVNR